MMDQQLTVKLTFDEYDYVERNAENRNISKGELVRRLIEFGMIHE